MPITVRELRDYIDEAIKNEELFDEGEVFVSIVIHNGFDAIGIDVDLKEIYPTTTGLCIIPETLTIVRKNRKGVKCEEEN